MISFYPGPSRVYDEIPQYVTAAYRNGILSLNHRSEEFMALSKETVVLLRKKLLIPGDYEIFFATSATECWEMIAQSVIEEQSIHIYNGAFGEKWYEYTKKLKATAAAVKFEPHNALVPEQLIFNSGDVICLTQNETSNGTQVDQGLIRTVARQNPQHLIAIDATSSMGGIALDFGSADIWFASVQKCFGLPAGLAILICSPRAVSHFEKTGERSHYNSLSYVREMMGKYQTNCTPNVLGIYLLMRVLKKLGPISKVDKTVRQRAKDWDTFFSKAQRLSFLSTNKAIRSHTVMTITGSEEHVQAVKEKAKRKGFLLGEGYGALKKTSFRIANFPALKQAEVRQLMKFLKDYL